MARSNQYPQDLKLARFSESNKDLKDPVFARSSFLKIESARINAGWNTLLRDENSFIFNLN